MSHTCSNHTDHTHVTQFIPRDSIYTTRPNQLKPRDLVSGDRGLIELPINSGVMLAVSNHNVHIVCNAVPVFVRESSCFSEGLTRSKLINQCFSAAALRKRFEALIDKHLYVWGKFGVPLSVNHVF